MVGMIVSAFLLCWLPFAVMFAGSPFSSHIGHFFESNELADTVTWLGNTNTNITSSHHDITITCHCQDTSTPASTPSSTR